VGSSGAIPLQETDLSSHRGKPTAGRVPTIRQRLNCRHSRGPAAGAAQAAAVAGQDEGGPAGGGPGGPACFCLLGLRALGKDSRLPAAGLGGQGLADECARPMRCRWRALALAGMRRGAGGGWRAWGVGVCGIALPWPFPQGGRAPAYRFRSRGDPGPKQTEGHPRSAAIAVKINLGPSTVFCRFYSRGSPPTSLRERFHTGCCG